MLTDPTRFSVIPFSYANMVFAMQPVGTSTRMVSAELHDQVHSINDIVSDIRHSVSEMI